MLIMLVLVLVACQFFLLLLRRVTTSCHIRFCWNRWIIRAGMAMGTAMPRLLAAAGGLSWMVKGCSEEEGVMFASKTAAEVSTAISSIAFRILRSINSSTVLQYFWSL